MIGSTVRTKAASNNVSSQHFSFLEFSSHTDSQLWSSKHYILRCFEPAISKKNLIFENLQVSMTIQMFMDFLLMKTEHVSLKTWKRWIDHPPSSKMGAKISFHQRKKPKTWSYFFLVWQVQNNVEGHYIFNLSTVNVHSNRKSHILNFFESYLLIFLAI